MNNIAQIIQALTTSQNPAATINQMAATNPVVARALQMTQGKSQQDVMQIANNLAKEQGVNLDQVQQQLFGGMKK